MKALSGLWTMPVKIGLLSGVGVESMPRLDGVGVGLLSRGLGRLLGGLLLLTLCLGDGRGMMSRGGFPK